jgi:hypothetical protein
VIDVYIMLGAPALCLMGVLWVRHAQKKFIWGNEFPVTNPLTEEPPRPEYMGWYCDYARRFMQ